MCSLEAKGGLEIFVLFVCVCAHLSAEVNDCLVCALGIKLSLGPIQEHTINHGAIYLASSRSLKL